MDVTVAASRRPGRRVVLSFIVQIRHFDPMV